SSGVGTPLTSGATSPRSRSSAEGWMSPTAIRSALRASEMSTLPLPFKLPSGGMTVMAVAVLDLLKTKSRVVTVILFGPGESPVMVQLQASMPLRPIVFTGPIMAAVSTVTVGMDPCSTLPPIVMFLLLDGEGMGFRVRNGGMALTAQEAVVGVVA